MNLATGMDQAARAVVLARYRRTREHYGPREAMQLTRNAAALTACDLLVARDDLRGHATVRAQQAVAAQAYLDTITSRCYTGRRSATLWGSGR